MERKEALSMNEMTPEKWQEIKEIVADALEKPEEEQADFVRSRCAECSVDAVFVLELLSFNHSPGLAPLASSDADEANADAAGQQIGHYRVVRRLGQGGMGVVYLAHRSDDFQQEVAIKVLLPGAESEEILRRFLAERQFLASLNHPSIVHMIDGGTTPDGASYIVMEYVDGLPITEYCERHRLDLRARLELFRELCAAVQYAHQRLVVHRDLKPSNILVTSDGLVKLLDFGVAKQLRMDQGESGKTTKVALTPEFASPEQVRGESVTTATDVYSLGVILYELLTGVRPYALPDRAFQEMMRVICEVEPERPSSAVSKSPDKPESPMTTTAVWRRKLQGDLDTIILMALRKEPERRYSSVERFSEDISQFLNGLPVHAQPDTWRYRTGKFVRRNRLAVAAGVALTLSVLAGTGATYYEMKQERAQRIRAEQRFADVHRLANTLLFDVHDQIRDLPGSTPARKHIVEVALRYLTTLESDSAGDAGLQRDLALAYEKIGDIQGNPGNANLGDEKGAMASYETARRLLANFRDPEGRYAYGVLLTHEGDLVSVAGDNQAAARMYEEAIAAFHTLTNSGSADERVKDALESALVDLADLQSTDGRDDLARANYNQALDLVRQLVRQQPENAAYQRLLARCGRRLGNLEWNAGNWQQALSAYRGGFDVYDRLLRQQPDNIKVRHSWIAGAYDIADTDTHLNRSAEALELYARAEALAGRDAEIDPHDAQAMRDQQVGYSDMTRLYLRLGNLAKAEDSSRRELAIAQSLWKLNPQDGMARNDLAGSEEHLAEVLGKKHDFAAAIASEEAAMQLLNANLRANDSVESTVVVMDGLLRLANFHLDLGATSPAAKEASRQSAVQSLAELHRLQPRLRPGYADDKERAAEIRQLEGRINAQLH